MCHTPLPHLLVAGGGCQGACDERGQAAPACLAAYLRSSLSALCCACVRPSCALLHWDALPAWSGRWPGRTRAAEPWHTALHAPSVLLLPCRCCLQTWRSATLLARPRASSQVSCCASLPRALTEQALDVAGLPACALLGRPLGPMQHGAWPYHGMHYHNSQQLRL